MDYRKLVVVFVILLFVQRTFAESEMEFTFGEGVIQSDNFGREKVSQYTFTADIISNGFFVSFLSSVANLTPDERATLSPRDEISISRYQIGSRGSFETAIGLLLTRYGVGMCSYDIYGNHADSIRNSYLCYQVAVEQFYKLNKRFAIGYIVDLTVSPQTEVGELEVRPFVLGGYITLKLIGN